jgi:cold shock CspA family protein
MNIFRSSATIVARTFTSSLNVAAQRGFVSTSSMWMGDVIEGKVKFFDSQKGFGFITSNESGEDIFVHQTAIKSAGFRSLAEGEDVEFEIETNREKQKPYAVNVTGPHGANVLGAPKRPMLDRRD